MFWIKTGRMFSFFEKNCIYQLGFDRYECMSWLYQANSTKKNFFFVLCELYVKFRDSTMLFGFVGGIKFNLRKSWYALVYQNLDIIYAKTWKFLRKGWGWIWPRMNDRTFYFDAWNTSIKIEGQWFKGIISYCCSFILLIRCPGPNLVLSYTLYTESNSKMLSTNFFFQTYCSMIKMNPLLRLQAWNIIWFR